MFLNGPRRPHDWLRVASTNWVQRAMSGPDGATAKRPHRCSCCGHRRTQVIQRCPWRRPVGASGGGWRGSAWGARARCARAGEPTRTCSSTSPRPSNSPLSRRSTFLNLNSGPGLHHDDRRPLRLQALPLGAPAVWAGSESGPFSWRGDETEAGSDVEDDDPLGGRAARISDRAVIRVVEIGVTGPRRSERDKEVPSGLEECPSATPGIVPTKPRTDGRTSSSAADLLPALPRHQDDMASRGSPHEAHGNCGFKRARPTVARL
jgi:hypothetical protein